MLETQEQILVEQRVANDAKSVGAAYVLWFFLGSLGMHRLYLGRHWSALAMFGLTLCGGATLLIGVGAVLLLAVGVWWIVDAFLIPGMVQADKNRLRRHHQLMLRDF